MGNEHTLPRRQLLAAAAAGTATLAGCGTDSESGAATDTASPTPEPTVGTIAVPDSTRIGERPELELTGFTPDTEVTLSADATDATETAFEGSWTLQTDSEGRARLPTTQPKWAPDTAWVGTLDRSSTLDWSRRAMLLGSLTPSAAEEANVFVHPYSRSAEVEFEAQYGSDSDSVTASTSRSIAPKVSAEPIPADDLYGMVCRPETTEQRPGIILLYGSSGDPPSTPAEILATHGYPTLVLQYFNSDVDGLPDRLRRVPLEYFDRAVEWFTGTEGVHPERIGLFGGSKGVEPALHTAAHHDGPATVVGYSGSGMYSPMYGRASWTRGGEPVAPMDVTMEVWNAVRDEFSRIDTPSESEAIRSVPENIREATSPEAVETVTIPVEQIDGSVLLLSGDDDWTWPSVALSSFAIDRFAQADHDHEYGLAAYPGAGHIFTYPYRNYDGQATSIAYGGDPGPTARAAAAAWPRMLTHYDRYLSP